MNVTIELFNLGFKAPLPVGEPALVPDGPEFARKHGGQEHEW